MGKQTGKLVWSFERFEHPRFVGDSWFWFRDFLAAKSDSTQRNYINDLKKFMEYYDYTTESLFQEHLEYINDKEDPRKKKIIGTKLVTYQRHLIETEGKATGTVNNIMKAVKAFFRINELDFQLNGTGIKVVKTEIPIIQKGEIVTILDSIGSIRIKAVIHTGKDSGLRIGDVCTIRIEDIQPILDEEMRFYTWEITQEKTGLKANPVIGEEAITWIRKWVQEMGRTGIESEWLFPMVEDQRSEKNIGDKCSADSYSQLFRHYRDKVGFGKVSIHSLRKYHKTNLEYAGVPTSWVNKMQGRVGEGTGGVYTKPNPEQLIDIYSQAYPVLSLETLAPKSDIASEIAKSLRDVDEEKLEKILAILKAAKE